MTYYQRLVNYLTKLRDRLLEFLNQTPPLPEPLKPTVTPSSVKEPTSKTPKRTRAPSYAYIQGKYQKEIDKRKTEKGKSVQIAKLEEVMKFFSPQNRASLEKMFEMQKLIVLAKLKLINKLNSLKKIDTFVRTSKGYKVTGEEGYVAIDKLGGDAVKLVDRMEFSYNNFSPDILKGWEKS